MAICPICGNAELVATPSGPACPDCFVVEPEHQVSRADVYGAFGRRDAAYAIDKDVLVDPSRCPVCAIRDGSCSHVRRKPKRKREKLERRKGTEDSCWLGRE